jgi:hypothetical protein
MKGSDPYDKMIKRMVVLDALKFWLWSIIAKLAQVNYKTLSDKISTSFGNIQLVTLLFHPQVTLKIESHPINTFPCSIALFTEPQDKYLRWTNLHIVDHDSSVSKGEQEQRCILINLFGGCENCQYVWRMEQRCQS